MCVCVCSFYSTIDVQRTQYPPADSPFCALKDTISVVTNYETEDRQNRNYTCTEGDLAMR